MRRLLSPRVLLPILIALLLIAVSAVYFKPPLPTIALKPEPIPGWNILGFPITNTLLATLLADITVILIGLTAARRMQLVPGGLQNLIEALFEAFYNFGQDLVGATNMRRFFPVTMTIFLLILAANWWERVPIFDSIGIIEEPHEAGVQTWKVERTPLGIYTITSEPGHISEEHPEDEAKQPATGPTGTSGAAKAGAESRTTTEEPHGPPEEGILVPFLRGVATDLNFTIAMALIAFVYIQYHGFRALGVGYLGKFFNLSSPITIFVGLLEFISEFAKIISFSFRLFGNIFAGTVLLFVMQFLVPWLLPSVFGLLEVLIGFVQAGVFAVLTLVFLAQAMESHHEEEHHPVPATGTATAETEEVVEGEGRPAPGAAHA